MELLQPVKILKFLLFDMRQKKLKNKFQRFALSLGHAFGYAPGPLQSHDLIGQNVDSRFMPNAASFLITDI